MRSTRTMLWLAILTLVCIPGCGDDESTFEYQTHVVRKVDMMISIRQKGEIEARDPVKISNPLEGKCIILDLVDEGSYVEKGDWLFELDVSEQRDKLLQQEISTSTAEQTLFTAEQQLEIQRQQNQSDIKKAELNLLFAELDLKQYVEGDLPRERETLEAEITLATEELKRANETLSWSIKLAEKGYISNDKLESDRLAVKRQSINQDLANRKKSVLDKYTSQKSQKELQENLSEAGRELLRVKARAAAAESQDKNEVSNRRSQSELEKQKLARLKHMVENNVVKSPCDGLVIYGREGRGRDTKPIEPGTTVREGQSILTIPNMERVVVDVNVHESSVHLVQLKQPVIVSTDTGETLRGEVEFVATVADSQSWYRNPDLKVYSTKVTVDNKDRKLRPGMNCYAEIVIDHLEDVTAVPVQAVHDNGEKSYVYLKTDGEPILTEVELGLNNNELVHVKSGISTGDEVFLAAPHDAEPIPIPKSVGSNTSSEILANLTNGESKGGGTGNANGGGARKAGANGGRRGDGNRSRGEGRGNRGGRGRGRGERGASGRGPGAAGATEEQKERWRKMSENMTEEQKKAMRERMGNRGGNRGSRDGGGQ